GCSSDLRTRKSTHIYLNSTSVFPIPGRRSWHCLQEADPLEGRTARGLVAGPSPSTYVSTVSDAGVLCSNRGRDPAERVGGVCAVGVGVARADAVGDERVDAEHDVRAPEQ